MISYTKRCLVFIYCHLYSRIILHILALSIDMKLDTTTLFNPCIVNTRFGQRILRYKGIITQLWNRLPNLITLHDPNPFGKVKTVVDLWLNVKKQDVYTYTRFVYTRFVIDCVYVLVLAHKLHMLLSVPTLLFLFLLISSYLHYFVYLKG